METTGWIKLHRKITGWKWYGNGNTVRVFLHLLLSCPPGEASCRVSIQQMAETLGISYKEARVAITHLLSDGTITVGESSRGRTGATVFAIVNWRKFQTSNKGEFNPHENQGLTEEAGRISRKKGELKGELKGEFNPHENQGLTEEQGELKGEFKGTPYLKNNKERLEKTRAHTHVREESPETPASPLTTGFPLPKSITDVQMVATARGIVMSDEELQDFYDWHTARGWRDAQGFQFHDWRFIIRGWVARRRKAQTNTGDNNGYSRTIQHHGGKIGQNFSGGDYGVADDYAPLPSDL